MKNLTFVGLNRTWRPSGNAPMEKVVVDGSTVTLPFFYTFHSDDRIKLTFQDCARWHDKGTNDEGLSRGECRYSNVAHHLGGFHELIGEDDQRFGEPRWNEIAPVTGEHRHFLMYLRDTTFECFAKGWSVDVPWDDEEDSAS